MSSVDYSSAYAEFERKLSTIRSLQERINAGPAIPIGERDVIFESMFSGIFRSFENFVENCFILSMQGGLSLDGSAPSRYANPIDRKHARSMLLGAQTVLDWTTSTTVLRRHDIFFKEKESGLYVGVSAVSGVLNDAKDLRNHIAHNSDESLAKYTRVVGVFLPTPPLELPTPGALLADSPKSGPSKQKQVLSYFRDRLAAAGKVIAGAT